MAKTERKRRGEDQRQATVVAPLADFEDRTHTHRRVDLTLSREQSVALKRLWNGLDVSGEVLMDGRRVASPAAGIKWLLEQLNNGE